MKIDEMDNMVSLFNFVHSRQFRMIKMFLNEPSNCSLLIVMDLGPSKLESCVSLGQLTSWTRLNQHFGLAEWQLRHMISWWVNDFS